MSANTGQVPKWSATASYVDPTSGAALPTCPSCSCRTLQWLRNASCRRSSMTQIKQIQGYRNVLPSPAGTLLQTFAMCTRAPAQIVSRSRPFTLSYGSRQALAFTFIQHIPLSFHGVVRTGGVPSLRSVPLYQDFFRQTATKTQWARNRAFRAYKGLPKCLTHKLLVFGC